MKKFLLILCAICGVCACSPDALGQEPARLMPAKKIKVFLLAGQSNLEGKGDGGKLSSDESAALQAAQRHVRFAYNREPVRPLDLTPAGPGNKKRFGVDFTFGPELFFGLRVAQAWPDDEREVAPRPSQPAIPR